MKRLVYIQILLSVVFINIKGQNLNNAIELENSGYYIEAIKEYEGCLNLKLSAEERPAIIKRILFSHLNNYNYNKAYETYKDNPNLSFSKKEFHSIFHLLRAVKEYEKASILLDSLHLTPQQKSSYSQDFIQWPLNNAELKQLSVKATNLAPSKCHGITFYKDGIIIPFEEVESNKTSPFKLFYYQLVNDTNFNKISPLFKTQEYFYNGTPFFDSSNNKLIYTSSNSLHKNYTDRTKAKYNISSQGKNHLQLISHDFDKNEKINLLPKNTEESIHSPFLYKDSILFFCKTTTKQKSDLFYSTKKDKLWQSPKPLLSVNTLENDVYPYIENNHFYFASRGRNGYGGLDIYEGDLTFNQKGEPEVRHIENMGASINSSYDDFAFIINAKGDAYWASNRSSEKDQIYTTTYKRTVSINGIVKNQNAPIEGIKIKLENTDNFNTSSDNGIWNFAVKEDATVHLYFSGEGYRHKKIKISEPKSDSSYIITLEKNVFQLKNSITNAPITDATITIYEKEEPDNWIKTETVATNENGEWIFDFDIEKKYKVTVEAKDFKKKEIYIPKEQREIDDFDFFEDISPLDIEPEAKGTLTINNIYFDYNSSKIKKESIPILNNLTQYLINNKEIKVELSAHTDCIGSNQYNLKLSEDRAYSCLQFLLKNNIDKNQITAKGYGELIPLYPCDRQRKEEEFAKLNRRIEVKFLN